MVNFLVPETPPQTNSPRTCKQATINSLSFFGRTPFDRLLVAAGADTVAVDCRKQSPADVIGESMDRVYSPSLYARR